MSKRALHHRHPGVTPTCQQTQINTQLPPTSTARAQKGLRESDQTPPQAMKQQ